MFPRQPFFTPAKQQPNAAISDPAVVTHSFWAWRIFNAAGRMPALPGLDKPSVLGPADGFQASMHIQFAQNVLNVIVDGCASDVKLRRNPYGRPPLGQQLKDLNFSPRQVRLQNR